MSFDRFEDREYIIWAKRIKQLDKYTCQICFAKNVPLHSHHLNAWNLYVSERYDLNNGVCICERCHDALHHEFGKGNNTKEQYFQFRNIVNTLRKVIYEQPYKDGYQPICRVASTKEDSGNEESE